MKRTMKVMVNGKPYEVELGDASGGQMVVPVNGVAFQVTLEEGQAPVVTPAAPVKVPAAAPAARPAPRPAASAPATGASSNAFTAPMPGVIMDISVEAGQKVSVGQQLCALEAMKMKNAIRSPREGVISAVAVTEGQRVNYGDVLFQFE